MKKCNKCKRELGREMFYSDKAKKDGLRYMCKECYKEYNKVQNNKEYRREYHQNHKEHNREYAKEYHQNNKEKRRIYKLNRRHNDIEYKISKNLRGRFYNAIKNNSKSGSAVRDLGCSIPEVRQYIEKQFKEGMTWDNWSFNGWHIDHITPLDFFDLTDRDQLLKAVHYTNLQPMWAEENLSKGCKLVSIK